MTPPFIRKLRIPIYKAALWVVVHPSLTAGIDHVEDLISTKVTHPQDKKYIKAMAFAYEDDASIRKFILFLRPSATPGEIAHECKHLANVIFRWYGQHLSTANDENECYFLEDIVDKAHNAIKAYKKKKSKESLAQNEIIL